MNTLNKLTTSMLALILLTLAFGFTPITKKINGDIITQQRTVSPFSKLEASSGVNVIIKQGDTFNISVTADANNIDKIKTTISQNTLNIRVDHSARLGNSKVVVTVPNLKSIRASSSANVKSDGDLIFDKLEIEASSGADIKLHLMCKLITSNCSSGSAIHLIGKTVVLVANASSGADLLASSLIAENGKITAESGSEAKVNVTGEAEFNASSGGDIKYYSQPEHVYKNTSSGGDIERKDK